MTSVEEIAVEDVPSDTTSDAAAEQCSGDGRICACSDEGAEEEITIIFVADFSMMFRALVALTRKQNLSALATLFLGHKDLLLVENNGLKFGRLKFRHHYIIAYK